ncbi:hypothetical protein J7I84_07030 [Arthrobacter sp. ISL-85]|uniref:hypothetical protein n=1 Tax=Arthrobacter sp. ISL-85 TaxID=2819115 RepID=UPI001BECB1AB|nr:hypothetical protein [Arthrobacter sp. ISL-85]MBT2566254.1 hypothetical protein [Arthrobacter sp. ISL-85]
MKPRDTPEELPSLLFAAAYRTLDVLESRFWSNGTTGRSRGGLTHMAVLVNPRFSPSPLQEHMDVVIP